jgi:transposase
MSEKTTRRKARNFTDEFKKQLVELSKAGKSKAEICQEYDIVPSLLRAWIKKYDNSGSFKEADNRSEEEKELIELRKRNKQLEMENDILKQAALIMGRK